MTISCEQNTVINIKAGIWGRTVPYEEQCYCDGCVVDTNCVSEASNEIVSILIRIQRKDEPMIFILERKSQLLT